MNPDPEPIKPRSPTLRKPAKLLCYLGSVLFVAMLLAIVIGPALLSHLHCPAETFGSGSTASSLASGTIVLLIIGCAGLALRRYGMIVPVPGTQFFVSAPRFMTEAQFVCLLAGIIGLCAVIWLNSFEAYYCITPKTIFYRSGLFETEYTTSWSKITYIKLECEKLKRNLRLGYLTVNLPDGSSVPVRINTEAERQAVSTSLEDVRYQYVVSPTVTSTVCPSDLFPVLKSWRP